MRVMWLEWSTNDNITYYKIQSYYDNQYPLRMIQDLKEMYENELIRKWRM